MGDQEIIHELIKLGKLYYDRQWMFATAGNLSFRCENENHFCITASDKHKGKLLEVDFVKLSINSFDIVQVSGGNKPSAEASIHRSIYNHKKNINAVLHVHTLSSNILNYQLTPEQKFALVPIPNVEIIKAFGIWNEKPNLEMAVFYNFGSVSQIAESILIFFDQNPDYNLPFILVEEHGPTVWGESLEAANQNLEAVAFLLDVMRENKK